MTFKVKDGLALGSTTILDSAGNITVPEKLTLSNTTTTRASLNLGSGTSDPSAPATGDVWLNSGILKVQQSGGTVTLATTSNNLGVFAATTSAQLASVISDETGSGALVFANSPTLTTPSLGAATATTINKVTITAPLNGSTLTIADGKTATISNTLTFQGTDASTISFGSGGTVAYTNSNITGTATTATNLIGGNNTTLLGAVPYQSNTNVTTLLSPNTSTTKMFLNQTGTGTNGAAPVWSALANADIPATLTGKTYNGLSLTANTTGFSVAGGSTTSKTLTLNNTLTFSGTDASSVAFGAGGTVAYTSNNLSVFSSTTSSQLAGVISDETGSGVLVFGTSPTFTTDIRTPLIYGSTAASGSLTLASTTDVTKGSVIVGGSGDTVRLNTTTNGFVKTSGANGTLTYDTNTYYASGGTDVSVTDGGTGTSTVPTAGGIIYGASTSAYASTAAGTAGAILRSGGAAAPSWSSATFPSTVAVGDILYGSAINTVSALTVGASGTVLKSNGSTISWAADVNTYPTTWTWTAGSGSGPTATITGTSSDITVAAIPAASSLASGIVTTGTQSFAGSKTFDSTITGTITKASTLAQGGGTGAAMTFNYAGQSGQPNWLWGTNDGTSINVYNPSNFSVSSAATLTTARNINGVSFNGSTDITVPSLYDTNYRRITNPGGAEYVSGAASVTGAIAVTLPVGMTNSMVRFTIKVYEYVTNQAFEVNVGGYNYSTGSSWANNPFAYIVGNPSSDRRFNVRFGYTAGGKAVVYIGELASTWAYPQVYVTDIQVGYGGQSVSYTSGWSIGMQSVAFENVTATVSNSQVGYAVSTNTANSVVLRDASGNFSAGTITASLSGNATTAATWQTARTLTIGSTGKSVNGSANVSWTLGEIGAAATSHSHGNITSSGAIGTSAGFPIITTAGGVLTTGEFGTTAGSFCAGDDSRLSNARAANGGTSTYVTINYNNDSNASYQMLWGSGNGVYGTAGITCNPSTDELTVGSLYSSGSVTAYSDERLKKDWEDLPTDFVNKLASVKVGKYTRIDTEERQVGVSAQSLQEILPEVIKEKDGYLGVNYGNAALSAVIMMARKIEELEARIAALEAK